MAIVQLLGHPMARSEFIWIQKITLWQATSTAWRK